MQEFGLPPDDDELDPVPLEHLSDPLESALLGFVGHIPATSERPCAPDLRAEPAGWE